MNIIHGISFTCNNVDYRDGYLLITFKNEVFCIKKPKKNILTWHSIQTRYNKMDPSIFVKV